MIKEIVFAILYITGLTVCITVGDSWKAQIGIELVGVCIIIITILIAKGDKPQ